MDGIEEFYGLSVHHCLYCDGFEYAGLRVAAYGKGDKCADLALMVRHWASDVVACSGGTEVSEEAARKLELFGIPLRTDRIRCLRGSEGRLSALGFDRGNELAVSGIFVTGCHQASDLSKSLGCKRGKGGVETDPLTEETSLAGVYVAGDVSRQVLLVAVAIGEGAKAAIAINRALLK